MAESVNTRSLKSSLQEKGASGPADTPWWTNLVAVILTAVVSSGATWYALTRQVNAPTAPSGILSFFKDTITYTPHILLLFGVLADMLTYQGVYSIPSLIGLLSIVANWVMKYFWAGVIDTIGKLREILAWKQGPPPVAVPSPGPGVAVGGGLAGDFFKNYDGCDVQGFDALHSPYVPQTLVVTATVFLYYIFDLVANRGWKNATAAIIMFIFLFGAEVAVIGNCAKDPTEPATWLKAIGALAEGFLFGGGSYVIVQASAPERLPTSALPIFARVTRKDLRPGPNGKFLDRNGNPYICLPSGQCLPDLSTKESQSGFARLLAESRGTGAPPNIPDCPATSGRK